MVDQQWTSIYLPEPRGHLNNNKNTADRRDRQQTADSRQQTDIYCLALQYISLQPLAEGIRVLQISTSDKFHQEISQHKISLFRVEKSCIGILVIVWMLNKMLHVTLLF